jgi:hypothetical protein
MYKIHFEYGLSVKKNRGKKSSIIEVKVPIYKQFQEWFIEPKKQLTGKRQPPTSHIVGDPNSMLRILSVETLENHPSLAPLLARLILAVFR